MEIGPSAASARGVTGHLWTVASLAERRLRPPASPPAERFAGVVMDPVTGEQPVTGLLFRPAGARRIAVLIHGLGGSPESAYMSLLASSAHRSGLATLRLSLRGADGSGPDFYHGGLTADLHAALADPALSGFDEIVLAGLSLGGHVALRYATEDGDPRLRAVAAVSSPLDLAAGARAIDRPLMAPYRRYLLRGLRAHGERAIRGGILAVSPQRLRRVRTLREWDTLTVAPRFGFADAADYYARASVGSRVGELRCAALLLSCAADPMIPPEAVHPASLAGEPASSLTVHWARRGGHLAFPPDLDLGAGGEPGWAGQISAWLAGHTDADR